MAWSQFGLIEAIDINGLLTNNTNNLNAIWNGSTQTDDHGYGQTTVGTVSVGDSVNLVPWSTLINDIANIAAHQGSTITAVTTPSVGDTVSFFNAITTNITTVTTNRRNAAATGAETTSTATTAGAWTGSTTFTLTATFTSANAARYFFNMGGQLGINLGHPTTGGNNINALINELCTDVGTLWLSSGAATIGGTAFTGTTKVGGAVAGGSTVSTTVSFYAPGQMIQQFASATTMGGPTSSQGGTAGSPTGAIAAINYATGTFCTVTVAVAGAVVTFTVVIDEVPNGKTVAAGTTCTITARTPATPTGFTNTWGTPTLASAVATTNATGT